MASQAKLNREQTLLAEIKNYTCFGENNIAFTNYNSNRNNNNYLAQLVIYLRQQQQDCNGQNEKQKIVDLINLLQERILFDYKYQVQAVGDANSQTGSLMQQQVQQQQQQDSAAQTRFRDEVNQRFTNVEQALNTLVNMNAEELVNQEEISSGVMQAIASIEGVQQGVDAMHSDLKRGFESIQRKMADCIPPPAEPLKILYCFLSLISLIIVVLVLVHKIYYRIAITTARIGDAIGGSIPVIGGFLGATMQGMTLIIFALAYINFITFITGGLIQGTVIAGNILYYIRVFIETIFGFALDNLRGLNRTLTQILGIAFPEFEGIHASLVNLKEAIIALFSPYIEEAKEEVAQAAREAARGAVANTVRAPVNAVGNAMGAAANATSNALSTASDAVADALGGAVDFTRRNIRMGGGDGSGMGRVDSIEKFVPGSTSTKKSKGTLSECLIDAVALFGNFADSLIKLANKLESKEIKAKIQELSPEKKKELFGLKSILICTSFLETPSSMHSKGPKSLVPYIGPKSLVPYIGMVKPFIKQVIDSSRSLPLQKTNLESINLKNFQPYFRMILLSSGSAGDPIEAKNYYSRLKKMPESKIDGSISSTVNGGKRRKKTRKKKRRKKRKSNKKRKNKKKRTKRKIKRRRTRKRRRR